MPYRQPRGELNPGGAERGCNARARRGGTAILVAGFASLINAFLPPSPRPPSRREGGDQGYFYARGFAPCIPGGCARATLASVNDIFGKVLGGLGDLFQESPGASLPLASPGAEAGCYNKFEESSGGFGGLFQESPGASPPLNAEGSAIESHFALGIGEVRAGEEEVEFNFGFGTGGADDDDVAVFE